MVTVQDLLKSRKKRVTVGGISTPEGPRLVTSEGEIVGTAAPPAPRGRVRRGEPDTVLRDRDGVVLPPPTQKPAPSPTPTPTEEALRQSLPEGVRELPPAEAAGLVQRQVPSAIPGISRRPRTPLVAPQPERKDLRTRIEQTQFAGEPVFITGETDRPIVGRIESVNIGGFLRGSFRGFTGLVGRTVTDPFLQRGQELGFGTLESREERFGSGLLARGFEFAATQRFDSGQIGVELFFVPAFGVETGISQLARPRTIFRQPVTEEIITSRTLITREGKIPIVGTEARTLIPARFETRASPAGELFGEFITRQISPRRTGVVFSEVGVTQTGAFRGAAIRKIITGRRTGPKEIFKLRGRAQEIALDEGIVPLERRALERIGIDVRKGVAISEDVKFFRTGAEAAELFRVRKQFIDFPPVGRRVTRTAGVTVLRRPIPESERIFQTLTGTADISLGPRGGRIRPSAGVIVEARPVGVADEFFVKRAGLKTKPGLTPVQASAETARGLTESLAKIKPPSIRPTPPTPSVRTEVLPGPGAFAVLRQTPSPFAGTGLFERADLVSAQVPPTAPGPTLVPTGLETAERPGISDIQLITPSGRVGLRQPSGLAPRQRRGPKTIPRTGAGEALIPETPQVPVTVLEPEITPPPRVPITPRFRPRTPLAPRGRFFLPFLPGLGLLDFPGRRIPSKRKLKRQPSLIAVSLGITAPSPVLGEETGLVARPVLR